MCQIMEEYAEKRAKQAAKKAAEIAAEVSATERSVSMATELWNDGMRDLEKIAKLTKLSLDEVKKLFEGKTA